MLTYLPRNQFYLNFHFICFNFLYRLEVTSNILRFYLDGQRVGYEVEFSAAHNFLDPDLEKIVIGNAKQNVEGTFLSTFVKVI